MEHSVGQLPSALDDDEGSRIGDSPDHVDAESEAEARVNRQRRRIQNRKNQRARRLRIKEQDPTSVEAPRQFKVMRWRLDELDDYSSEDSSSASKGGNATYTGPRPPPTHVTASMVTSAALRRTQPGAPVDAQTSLTPPSFTFPLSMDHLLHLIQYNVFRAFVSNKCTLNLLLTGRTDKAPSPTTCPMSGPYRDDTCIYPLNPNIPPCLFPTQLQQTRLHMLWINFFPFPRLRNNLIMGEGMFDHWELLGDLIGELMGTIPTQTRRGTPLTITVSDPPAKRIRSISAGGEEDEVTAGRKGLVVWGEPHDMRSWEATPGFMEKWSWAVEGCHELVESSNRWRVMRGEEPMRLSGSTM